MERLSDKAIEIINTLHTERLDYYSEYLPLIDCVQKCATYEDTGLEPEEIKELCTDGVAEIVKILQRMIKNGYINHLQALLDAETNGQLVVLPCKPGSTVWAESPVPGNVYSFTVPDIEWLIENADLFGKELFLTKDEAEAVIGRTVEDG